MADRESELKQLREVLAQHRRVLEQLESTLIAFEESLEGTSIGREAVVDQPAEGVEELLSIPEVCQVLGMGKSWVYRRLKDGDIPSIKLGRAIKVRQADLEKYLESQRYIPPSKISRQ